MQYNFLVASPKSQQMFLHLLTEQSPNKLLEDTCSDQKVALHKFGLQPSGKASMTTNLPKK
jgi:hypothetical protein